MKPIKLLGIAGFSRSGKDTFFGCLKEINPAFIRGSFADKVKEHTRVVIKTAHDIDIFECTPEQKEFCRPILINYAVLMRQESNGKFWIDELEKNVKPYLEEGKRIVAITDVRYKNETEWVQSLGGKVVHLKKYITNNGSKMYQNAPNNEEKENDPQVEAIADLHFEWEHGFPTSHRVNQIKEFFKTHNYEIQTSK